MTGDATRAVHGNRAVLEAKVQMVAMAIPSVLDRTCALAGVPLLF